MISHVIPGRIRLRHSPPLSAASFEMLALRIRAVAPLAAVTHNERTGQTLILFKEKSLTAQVLALWQQEGQNLQPVVSRGRPVSLWPPMRRIKHGMTLSLLASLGLLAMRREGGHAVTGTLFLAMLSRHVWVYRKRLWK